MGDPRAPATTRMRPSTRRTLIGWQAILDTAAAMLLEMPVAEVSLNELSRRVGLAKSNVLRYFESREAVLLELLDRASKQWLDELPASSLQARQSQQPQTRSSTEHSGALGP